MKKVVFLLICSQILFVELTFSRSIEKDSLSIAEQIKVERDSIIKAQQDEIRQNELQIVDLQTQLSTARTSNTKLQSMDKLMEELDKRVRLIEQTPKLKTKSNAQLAFIELLGMQRDIKPAKLFNNSIQFFNALGDVGKLQYYTDYTDWKTKYDTWYGSQKKKDIENNSTLSFFNQSINLLNNIPNPYSSLIQIASIGIGQIMTLFNKKNSELANSTPAMYQLLATISQFENEKSIINYEWEMINEELKQFVAEDSLLLEQMLRYFDLEKQKYISEYQNVQTETKRDKYKSECRKTIINKIDALETKEDTKYLWVSQVESYMYKVQSLRIRFGELTYRMMLNLEKYKQLINNYSDSSKGLPSEFSNKVKGLEKPLNGLIDTFDKQFNPRVYIEESAVMYIETINN